MKVPILSEDKDESYFLGAAGFYRSLADVEYHSLIYVAIFSKTGSDFVLEQKDTFDWSRYLVRLNGGWKTQMEFCLFPPELFFLQTTPSL